MRISEPIRIINELGMQFPQHISEFKQITNIVADNTATKINTMMHIDSW